VEWPKWKKSEAPRLACYVQAAETARVFGVPDVKDDLRRHDRIGAVRRVYEHLARHQIAYNTSAVDFAHYSESDQLIREPREVHEEDSANCLELALLFSALCQKAGLRPLIVLLERHAMVAVRLDEDVDSLRDTLRPGPNDWELLSGGVVPPGSDFQAKEAKLAEWVQQGRCVLVECTGMARGPRSRSFDDAVAEGPAKLGDVASGSLTQIVDVTFLHLNTRNRYEPYPISARPMSSHVAEVTLGDAAIEVVEAHLARLENAPATPQAWNTEGLRSMLTGTPANSDLDTLLKGLCEVLEAAAFVRAWMPHALSSGNLRAALMVTFTGRQPCRGTTDTDYFAHVFLHRLPASRQADWRTTLFDFIVTLALGAGLDVRQSKFRAWADRVIGPVATNDVLDKAENRRIPQRWRLRLSLHGPLKDDWPEQVTAWLFDGEIEHPLDPRECQPSQSGVEAVISELVAEATDRAIGSGDELAQVEIAVPTSLLVRWRPEEIAVVSMIGLHHNVVVRWSGRLGSREMLLEAPRRWPYIERQGPAGGLDWLEREQTLDLKTVQKRLANGTWQGGVGLRFLPERCDDLLDKLLTFSPVLLWPDVEACGWDGIEQELHNCWESLPDALAEAYRGSWKEESEPSPLAVVRAVWDDPQWLAFCHRYLRTRASLGRLGG
jgi:hypothetical protein